MNVFVFREEYESSVYFLCPKCNQISQGIVYFKDMCIYELHCKPLEISGLSELYHYHDRLFDTFWSKYGNGWNVRKDWIDNRIWVKYIEDHGIITLTPDHEREIELEIQTTMNYYDPLVKEFLKTAGINSKLGDLQSPCPLAPSAKSNCDFKLDLKYPEKTPIYDISTLKHKSTPEQFAVLEPFLNALGFEEGRNEFYMLFHCTG